MPKKVKYAKQRAPVLLIIKQVEHPDGTVTTSYKTKLASDNYPKRQRRKFRMLDD